MCNVMVPVRPGASPQAELTFPTRAEVRGSRITRAGEGLPMYFAWPFPSQAREGHSCPSLPEEDSWEARGCLGGGRLHSWTSLKRDDASTLAYSSQHHFRNLVLQGLQAPARVGRAPHALSLIHAAELASARRFFPQVKKVHEDAGNDWKAWEIFRCDTKY